MIFENDGFQSILGLEQGSETKASTEFPIFAFEMASCAEVSGRLILPTLIGPSQDLEEDQGVFKIALLWSAITDN